MTPRLPDPVWAALCVLRLDRQEVPSLARIDEAGWRQALDFTDRAQATLSLRHELIRKGFWDQVPTSIRQRLDRNQSDNAGRWTRIQNALGEIAGALGAAGIDFVVLKGVSHSPDFVADPRIRVQYDIDLYCPGGSVFRARDVLSGLGYEPLAAMEPLPTDHLPTMVRKTGWRWRGNFYDPELPPAVDLHFRFWDQETERLAAPGVEEFWTRRAGHELDPVDRLGYAALHAVRHLLRGALRLNHFYEIAQGMERRRGDSGFWSRWTDLHPPATRLLELIAFRLAQTYFGIGLDETPCTAPLPHGAEEWLKRYAWSPVEAPFHPNKHELYLHLTLLSTARDKLEVVRRRLLPTSLPGPVEGVHVPERQMTLGIRVQKWTRYVAYVVARLIHHARVLLPTLWGLVRWTRAAK